MEYDNTNTGMLSKNDKDGNEKRPDYKGSINIEGTDYWLSAWIRTAGENAKVPGSKFMSLKAEMKEKHEKPAPNPSLKASPKRRAQGAAPFDDGYIPF